ncbi:archaea-specific SMC-related protein [Natrialbaceae archaeon A-CW3]
MSSGKTTTRPRVTVENIGGIDSTTVELTTGVNILTGRNATNRTSFLRSIMGALGSDQVSLKADTESGSIRLEIDGETYERHFERQNGQIVSSGDSYLDDPTLANLFAFLLESNTARQAVSQKDDLREVIMRPVDVDEITAQIDQAETEKRRLDEEIDRITSLKSTLPALEERRQSIREQIAETETELEETRAELEAKKAEADDDDDELDAKLEELQSARGDLEETEFQLETERRSIDTLESELEDLTAELEELPDALETDPDAIEHELETLREQRSSLDSETTQLQSIIQFNEEMLDGTNPEITAALSDEDEAELTDQLLADDGTVVCWTCGTEVDTEQIEATIDRLRSLRQEKVQERNRLRQQIDDRKQTLRDARQTKQRRQRVTRQLEETETEIEDRNARLETLTEREDELRVQVEELEDTVEELEQEDESETLDRQKNVTELEFRLGQLENDLDDIEAEIEETETELERVDDLQAERDTVSERLTDLRTRIDRLERESVDAFNEHMAAVLDVLEYENIERIWIERTEQTVREGRRHVDRPTFELHIVRQAADGHTYEDTIDHLSESEREVTGLVFALAGYLVHGVYEKVPFMLLDSLEAIDSNRIARLVDYFSEYAETVVVALLPEDAEALDDEYTRVTSI